MLFLFSERMAAHNPGDGHPESPNRLLSAARALRGVAGAQWLEPRPADRGAIVRAHDESYVARIDALRGQSVELDADTHLSEGSVDAAYLAAGAAIEATRAVVSGEHRHAVALVRPPGHHAERDRAMGFCLFNNVAIAAAHARAELGCERVLIVDWDVHHGNGTQQAFEADRNVLFMSLHQFPLYPGTGGLDEIGVGSGAGYTVNVPWPEGLGDGDYIFALCALLVPIADAFKPDLVLVSAGFDAHVDDPLAGMRLTTRGYVEMMSMVKSIAERHAKGRVVLVLEGGYNLEAMPRSLRACVDTLTGASTTDPLAPTALKLPTASPDGRTVVEAVMDRHQRFWPLR
jgi:acetoin utilization deacetylase AcuC-like enzyme